MPPPLSSPKPKLALSNSMSLVPDPIPPSKIPRFQATSLKQLSNMVFINLIYF